MVKINEITEFLNEFAPNCYAEDYDNVGLLVGEKDKEINKIMLTLDADDEVVKDAADKKCDLVISHHPLIFKPLKRVVSDDSVSRTVINLIKNDMSLISVHTNFDSVKSGLCDLFFDKIADTKERVSIEGDEENGCGRIAELECPSKLSEILETIKNKILKHYPSMVFSVENMLQPVSIIGPEEEDDDDDDDSFIEFSDSTDFAIAA